MAEQGTRRNLALIGSGIAIGAAYGLFVRGGAQLFPRSQVFGVMSVGFIFVLPLAVGFASVFVIERQQPQPVWMWLFVSSAAVVLGIVGTMLVFWEGWICALMFAPIGLIAGMIGGLIAGFWLRHRRRKITGIPLACVVILPLLITPWEGRAFARQDLRMVENTIEIDAPPAVVWRSIERVPRISSRELEPSWSHTIGFPNPVEATLSNEGIGGVRHATFEGGVLFVETIDEWEPRRRLGFSIRAQTAQIPPTTLDEHVTVGGKFFDVLHGEYVLEPLANGTTQLHLASRHRISTDFNWYAHLWTDAVMSDLQKRILFVVKNRSESAFRGENARRVIGSGTD
jgi:hypothetical protein